MSESSHGPQITLKDRLLALILFLVVRALSLTFRYRYSGREFKEQIKKLHPSGNYIVAVWHEFAIGSVLAVRKQNYTILVSSSRDGHLVDFFIRMMGLHTVRGSSHRGGTKAQLQLLQVLKKGTPVGITIDGPRGPRHIPKRGIVELARHSQLPIVPVAFVINPKKIFSKSWDQTQLPLPFAKIHMHFGRPIVIPPSLSQDLATSQLQEGLKETYVQAQKLNKSWRVLDKEH